MEKIAFSIENAFFGSSGHFLSNLTDLGTLVSILLSNAIVVAGLILVFLVIIAGFTMLGGAGDPQAMERGKNIITAAIIGFIIVLAAFFIVRLVENSLGVSILG